MVGLATARQLLTTGSPLTVQVVEKEPEVARHASGRNAGVIHSGAYYAPGSAKARLCLRGRERLIQYLDSHTLPYRICGKVVVATSLADLPQLRRLMDRARENGVAGVRSLTPKELADQEPSASGVAAVHIPTTGIVDYAVVARDLAREIQQIGGSVALGTEVTGFERGAGPTRVLTSRGEIRARFVVNCAGLHSDRVARLAGATPKVRIVPFRGEFFTVRSERKLNLNGAVYPAPHPSLPFVGVHATPTVHGTVEAGPNAVLAWAREGYRRTDFRLRDATETLTFSGFPRLIWDMRSYAATEVLKSWSRTRFASELSRIVPGVSPSDLVPRAAGVRAQAVGPDGKLVDDFEWIQSPGFLHVLNAPSPAATSSLAIAEEIVSQIPSLG